jgi:ribosomal protein S14
VKNKAFKALLRARGRKEPPASQERCKACGHRRGVHQDGLCRLCGGQYAHPARHTFE